MASVSVLILSISFFYATECAHQAVVNINARGITGNILFTEVPTGVRIQTSLRGLRVAAQAHAGDGGHDDGGHDGGDSHGHGGGGGYVWHVHILPIDQTLDPTVQCLSEWVGPHYDPFNARTYANYSMRCTQHTPELCEAGDLAGKFGNLMPSVDVDVTDVTGELQLSGPYSIIGRSLVIHSPSDGSNFECGTVKLVEHPGDTVTLLQATFTYPMAGVIYFKQIGGEDVSIWGKLYWVNDNQRTENHTWSITQTAPGEGHRRGLCGDVGNRYDAENRNPMANPSNCPTNASFCETGDLSRRLGFITVAAIPGPQQYIDSFFFTDSSLDLNNVRNRSISIGQSDMDTSIAGCAPLIDVEIITLQQPIDGYFTVSQQGPYEETIVSIASIPSRFISILNSALNPVENCPEDGILFDPYEKSDLVGEDTPDKYPLGDWKNRYNSQLSNNTVIRLFDIPVYGSNTSISSLSVRYITGSTRTCVALIPMLRGDNVVLAKATFSDADTNFNGAIYFVQRDFGFDQLGSTHIIADLSLASQGDPVSYNWYVHPQANQGCGEIFNPMQVSTADEQSPSVFSNYDDDCSPQNPLRCQAGDLSGKHGQLVISSDIADRSTFTFVDPNIQLNGMSSIIGQSIGINGGSGESACTQIQQAYISSRAIFVITDRDTMLRTGIARRLSSETSADFTDILVLRQEIFSIGFGFKCLNVTIRVLGPTPQEADTIAERVAINAGNFVCNHGISSVAPLSSMVMCMLLFILVILSV